MGCHSSYLARFHCLPWSIRGLWLQPGCCVMPRCCTLSGVMGLFSPCLSFPTVCTYIHKYIHTHLHVDAQTFYYQNKHSYFKLDFCCYFQAKTILQHHCLHLFICALYILLLWHKSIQFSARHKIQITSVVKTVKPKQNRQCRQGYLRSTEEWRLVLFRFNKYIVNITRQETDMFSSLPPLPSSYLIVVPSHSHNRVMMQCEIKPGLGCWPQFNSPESPACSGVLTCLRFL